MAEEKTEDSAAPASAGKKFNLELILLAVNFLAVAAAAGTVVYTKLLYKKPKITESQELQTIVTSTGSDTDNGKSTDGPMVTLDELRVNIASPDGNAHSAVFVLTAECADEESAARFKERKDQLTDRLISLFNKKKPSEINHVQGRLILKEEIIKELNAVLGGASVRDALFSTFIVQ